MMIATTTTRRTFVAGGVALATALGTCVRADNQTASTKEEKTVMATSKKILIGADSFAQALTDPLVAHLKSKGYEIIDKSVVDGKALNYYESAVAVCRALQKKEADRAILLCGTGMGMSVIANRFKGVTAAVVESIFAARMCRTINDANVLCMGSMVWSEWMAKEAVDAFLETQFTQGLEQLKDYLTDARAKVEAIRD